MCHAPRRAVSLADGRAHDLDHWTRRDFMGGLGLGVAGALLGAVPGRAFAASPLLPALASLPTDRVLVLVQLVGGNDGLNTVVPVGNDLYHAARPTLGLTTAQTLPLAADLRLHGALAPVMPHWETGHLAIVQSVGYANQNLSHFRSTDIWLSGSDADVVWGDGWGGRALATLYPDFQTLPPSAPPAVQVGTSEPLLFQANDTSYGMSVYDVETFLEIVEGGTPYDPTAVPPTAGGRELAFLRSVANDAFRYREAIADASAAAPLGTGYADDDFARTMASVARLIKGGLDTRVYLVALHGFDTHADQAGEHAALLASLGATLSAFFADLATSNDDQRTLAVTFSEFGRRVDENGSGGTDHGAAAPLFVMGPAAVGGLYGPAPDLSDTDADGNLRHAVDFRSIYASVLTGWLGLDAATTAAVLGQEFPTLPLLSPPVASGPAPTAAFALSAPRPNPTRGVARLTLALPSAGDVRLDVYDVLGRRLQTIVDATVATGTHEVMWDASRLPAGRYTLRLRSPAGTRSVGATVVR